MLEDIASLLDSLEDLPDHIAWGSFAFGAFLGGLTIASAIRRWYGVLLLIVGIPVMIAGLSTLMPAGLIPEYTLAFYVGGLAVLLGIAVKIG